MDMKAKLSRTTKGQEEIFNQGHTVRPKCRQILFAIGNGASVGELQEKLPNTDDLQTLLDNLLQGGYIEVQNEAITAQPATDTVAAPPIAETAPESPISTAPPPVAAEPPPAAQPAASSSQPSGRVEAARNHVLEIMASLAGTKSPAYRKMSEVQDEESFKEVLQMCRKVVAAVASPHQATEMETTAIQHLGG
jgi:hypothetical protein